MPKKPCYVVPTTEQADTIRRMRGEGKTYGDIADVLGVMEYRVQRMVQWMIRNGGLQRVDIQTQLERARLASVAKYQAERRAKDGPEGLPLPEVERRCAIFTAVRFAEHPLTAQEIAERTGESVAYVRRFLEETSKFRNAKMDTLFTKVGNRWLETTSIAEQETRAS